MLLKFGTAATALLSSFASTCDDHDWTSPTHGGYVDHSLMRRHDHDKRIQPGALSTLPQQIKDIHWGQLNILSTTDTHGWLAGHLLDENYSADYGDFADFVRKMKAKADRLGVDLLLVDSGDLHDGTGFGDATTPSGKFTLPVFERLPYDLLTVGNHELYVTTIANDTYHNFAPRWGGRYLTSNVDIIDNGVQKPLSQRYAYYQTKFGLRIMSFGFLFNFTGNSNASIVTPVGDAVQQPWFQEQIRRTDIDLFLLAGHIPVRDSTEWNLIYGAIRLHHPTTPIQILGGHRHVRDAVAWDATAMGTAAGRYCETVGWTTINGLPANTTHAKSPMGPGSISITAPKPGYNFTQPTSSNITYTRQYLDFNRPTFEHHTSATPSTFNTTYGTSITQNITSDIASLPQLNDLIGCSPSSYYLTRYPTTHPNSLYNFLTTTVFPAVVAASTRNTTTYPRIILTNTGNYRYDLLEGAFTIDTAYQVNPYQNLWVYTTAPWGVAKNVLAHMQTDRVYKRRDAAAVPVDNGVNANDTTFNRTTGLYETAGYVTTDDFGSDGDNTVHTDQGSYSTPHYVAANVSTDGITDNEALVDVYATTFFADSVGRYLEGNVTGWNNVTYVDGEGREVGLTTFETLPRFAGLFWGRGC